MVNVDQAVSTGDEVFDALESDLVFRQPGGKLGVCAFVS